VPTYAANSEKPAGDLIRATLSFLPNRTNTVAAAAIDLAQLRLKTTGITMFSYSEKPYCAPQQKTARSQPEYRHPLHYESNHETGW